VFLLCGVGVALVPPSKRFDLLFGCVFGAELAAFDIFCYDPVNQQGLREVLRAELAVSAVAVAAMCLFAKYVAWFTMVPVLYAAWSWVVIKQGDGKVKWWLQAVAGLPTKLRRACRVAWFRSRFGGGGLKGPPSGAQCCVCWVVHRVRAGGAQSHVVCLRTLPRQLACVWRLVPRVLGVWVARRSRAAGTALKCVHKFGKELQLV
jgi:hypothetical protein